MARQSPDEKKFLAAHRAKFRLQQTFERIDFEEELLEQTETIKAEGGFESIKHAPIEIESK